MRKETRAEAKEKVIKWLKPIKKIPWWKMELYIFWRRHPKLAECAIYAINKKVKCPWCGRILLLTNGEIDNFCGTCGTRLKGNIQVPGKKGQLLLWIEELPKIWSWPDEL